MKIIVTEYSFIEAFRGRETQFTRPALEALFAYFEQLEEDTQVVEFSGGIVVFNR